MKDNKIEIDINSGSVIKQDKREIFTLFKSKLNPKFNPQIIIIAVFIGLLVIFALIVSKDETMHKSVKKPVQLQHQIESELPVEQQGNSETTVVHDDISDEQIFEIKMNYIIKADDYHNTFLKYYDDLRSGYLSTTGFSGKLEKFEIDLHKELLNFSEYKEMFLDADEKTIFDFIYSRMENLSTYVSNIKAMISEMEIKKKVLLYIEADKSLCEMYSGE